MFGVFIDVLNGKKLAQTELSFGVFLIVDDFCIAFFLIITMGFFFRISVTIQFFLFFVMGFISIVVTLQPMS